ncbi:transposase [Exiguobacterium sp. s161]|uniref:transposase n=1 Tax=Exiguobacterium sp. s161 TaxID=2751191 RepID=UPI00352CC485
MKNHMYFLSFLIHVRFLVFRKSIIERCHGRTISDVAREYELPYTTVERWFYQCASAEVEKHTKHILVDGFATRKGQTHRRLFLMPRLGVFCLSSRVRDASAITAALQGVPGDVRSVVSDFAPAMAKAVTSVFLDATHVLDRFHLIQFFTDTLRRRRRFFERDETSSSYSCHRPCTGLSPRNVGSRRPIGRPFLYSRRCLYSGSI